MPTTFITSIWFVSSYTPLWIVLLIKYRQSYIAWGTFLSLILISNGLVFLFFRNNKKRESDKRQVTIVKSQKQDGLGMEFIASFVMAFIGFDLWDIYDTLSFSFLLSLFLILYVRRGNLLQNPMLEILGFQTYLIEFKNLGSDTPKTGLLLASNKKLKTEQEKVFVYVIQEGIYKL